MPLPALAMAIPSILGGLSSIFGGASKGAREDRILQDQGNLQRDQLNQNRFRINESLPGDRLSTSVRASRVRNAEPVQFQWGGPGSGLRGELPQFTGGHANPNAIDPRTRTQADDVLDQMIRAQMGRTEAPQVSQPGRDSRGGRILGGLALGSSILGGINALRPRSRQVAPPDFSDQYYGG